MASETITFRPSVEDRRIIEAAGGSSTAALRAGLRLLDRQLWLDQLHVDALRLRNEDINATGDEW
jgi:hypothetical protein